MTADYSNLGAGDHRVVCDESCCSDKRKKNCCVTVSGDGSWVSFCHRCGTTANGKGWRAAGAAPVEHVAGASAERFESLAPHYRRYWAELGPLQGVAREYLAARRCVVPPPDGDLRFDPALRHPDGYVGPALVALVTDANDGTPLTLHRTWIKADGTKANVEAPRRTLAKHTTKNGVVRLWPDDAVTTALAVAEGIETALTVAQGFMPVWSTLNAGLLERFPVLDGIESLLIAADNDPAGHVATRACAGRWSDAGRRVRIAMSDVPGEDLNDVAQRVA